MQTIMPTHKGRCYICGNRGFTHEHHIFFGTANRKKSEKYGMKVHLCPACHETGKNAVHKNREAAERLMRDGQAVFEAKIGDRKLFRQEFGKSYL